jgi:hypothetical protein
MQTVQFVLLQLDDAARHLRDGRRAQLRVALLLLDNAAEVLLHRWAKRSLQHDSLRRALHERARGWGAPASVLAGIDISAMLSPSDERKVLRLFDRLVKYAVLKRAIEPEIGDVLIYLHRYRNDAYHRAAVRQATIRTSVALLFDIVCRLALSDIGHAHSYLSGEDYSWLTERFELPQGARFVVGDDCRERAIDQLRESLPGDASRLGEAMATHLNARIDELVGTLDFISDATRPQLGRERALADAVAFVEGRRADPDIQDRMPFGYTGRVSLHAVNHVREAADALEPQANAIATFRSFAAAELELEHLEFPANELAAEIDGMIQLQVDIERGK